ncbi:MAG: universal stress protein, partial [Trueperaceae bacterium]|nr:universal stress protein [Trueperaceae bacterium]
GFNVHSRVLYGKPSDEIVKLAEAEASDFIAMTTHARGGLAEWVMGSVAQAVLHEITIPVIFLNPGRTY